MGDWISDALIFAAGVAGGVLISEILAIFRGHRRQRVDFVAVRARVRSDLKERHEREILHAALRTTEDIKTELNTSLQNLRKTVAAVLDPVHDAPERGTGRIVEPSQPRE
jgi:hypothetical protein